VRMKISVHTCHLHLANVRQPLPRANARARHRATTPRIATTAQPTVPRSCHHPHSSPKAVPSCPTATRLPVPCAPPRGERPPLIPSTTHTCPCPGADPCRVHVPTSEPRTAATEQRAAQPPRSNVHGCGSCEVVTAARGSRRCLLPRSQDALGVDAPPQSRIGG